MFSTNWEIIGRRALFEATWRVAFLAPQTSDGAAARAPRLFRRATPPPPARTAWGAPQGEHNNLFNQVGNEPYYTLYSLQKGLTEAFF
jgi:hypothetical protein